MTRPPETCDDHPQDLRSFGRRRGRPLTARQTRLLNDVLPRVRLDLTAPTPDHPEQLFSPPAREVWLEIGFGGGENLLWQAEQHSDVGIIGCEPFEEGIVKVLTAIDDRAIPNLRLWPDDARGVLRWLPPASLTRVFVLFPDPWPKKRHQKRRLLSAATLTLVARTLTPGGTMHIATDIPDYARTIFMALAHTPGLVWTAEGPSDWRQRPTGWPATRYEQKAAQEGRKGCWLALQKRS